MKIALLTSSRADYSIYLPLIKLLANDNFFDLSIVAFGTHLSHQHGYTVQFIEKDGFNVPHRIETMPDGDTPESIAKAMGKTMTNFSELWSKHSFDLVICLGDRYEMFAAVSSTVPFNLKVAHIHGGETTLGAIDNVFRHAISLMSDLHFVTTKSYLEKVVQLIDSSNNVHDVGALSNDNLLSLPLLSLREFSERFSIDLSKPSVLITFHPETVSLEKNATYTQQLIHALEELKQYQLIITMPNADTQGNQIREMLNVFISTHDNAVGIESFGTVGYLTCMKHCAFMLGNTSSGFVEAAWFPKYVINLGDRQKGRLLTPNIKSVEVTKEAIVQAVKEIESVPLQDFINPYGDGKSAQRIVAVLKQYHVK